MKEGGGKYDCVFSPDRTYRYALWVTFRPMFPVRRHAMFIGLNPSTADEWNLDPTLRKCVGFALRWNFDAVVMTNLFAFRATDPAVMRAAADPVGPENNFYLSAYAHRADLVVAAWGNVGAYLGRAREVEELLVGSGVRLCCVRRTKAGFPEHPLYLPYTLKARPWRNP